MDLEQSINSEADLAHLIDAYRRAVHAMPEDAANIIEQYPDLRQPITVTRDMFAHNPRAAQALELLAVDGMAERGFEVLAQKTSDQPSHGSVALLPQGAVTPEIVIAPEKPLDFSRVIDSVEDIRHLVAAYRLALHGGEAVAQKVYGEFPELQPLVRRTQMYAADAENATSARWEEIGVEALVERGLRTLDEKGLNPYRSPELAPER